MRSVQFVSQDGELFQRAELRENEVPVHTVIIGLDQVDVDDLFGMIYMWNDHGEYRVPEGALSALPGAPLECVEASQGA